MNISNIFDENSTSIFTRFSSVLLFVFFYYGMTYYYLINDEEQCLKKPGAATIVGIMVLHIIHIICLYMLWERDMFAYMWILAILPNILIISYHKYQEHQVNKQVVMEREMYDGASANQEMRNLSPGVNKPPSRDTVYVGVSNNSMKNGDQIAYHQPQKSNQLPPPSYDPQMQTVPGIARQPESMSNTYGGGNPTQNFNLPQTYDAESAINNRDYNNNTRNGQIQPLQSLDLNDNYGQMSGSGGLMGFDSYSSNLAAF